MSAGTLYPAAKSQADRSQVELRHMHGDQGTFVKVDGEPRGYSKLIQDLFQPDRPGGVSVHNDQCVIHILQDGARRARQQRVTQTGVLTNHLLEHISNKQKQIR
jgi:hypothetical protein